MAKLKWKGGALVAPVPPAMISCGSEADGTSNIITIAWTGIVNTVPPKTYISVRPSRHSYKLIKESGEFAINLTTSSLVRHADFCGIYTGAKVNKFEKCALTERESHEVTAPTIAECPIALECRVTDILQMGTHDVFMADIVSVSCDESIIDKNGKIRYDKADLLAYLHGEYFRLGEKVGKFGFSTDKSADPTTRVEKKHPAPKKKPYPKAHKRGKGR